MAARSRPKTARRAVPPFVSELERLGGALLALPDLRARLGRKDRLRPLAARRFLDQLMVVGYRHRLIRLGGLAPGIDPTGIARLALAGDAGFAPIGSGGLLDPMLTPDFVGLDLEGSRADSLRFGEHRFDAASRAESLVADHEILLELAPRLDLRSRTLRLSAGATRRKGTGSYYTPPLLIEPLLDAALEPTLAEFSDSVGLARLDPSDEAAVGHGEPPVRPTPRILDPACGVGHFLRAAHRRLQARGLDPVPALFGVDLDPLAVALTRAALWLESGALNSPLTAFDERIRRADALFDEPFPITRRGEAPDRSGGRDSRDPVVAIGGVNRDRRGGSDGEVESDRFDVILGNPPFVNAIEGGVPDSMKHRLRRRFPTVGGAADLAAYFLDRARELTARGGRIGMVLPRPLLGAESTRPLRRTLVAGGLRPTLIFAPGRANQFRGARVYVVALALGPETICRMGRGPEPSAIAWRSAVIRDDHWWRALVDEESSPLDAADDLIDLHRAERARGGSPTLGSVFAVSASMIADDAYRIAPRLLDDPEGNGIRLVTTGLIDPGECLWGRRVCRYLKREFRWPRVPESADWSAGLRRRLERARRPKILVAGLSKRVEAWFDRAGETIGAVSTWAIHHPRDDPGALERLEGWLNDPVISRRFRRDLGGAAMGGGNITMTRPFLEELPLPEDFRADLTPETPTADAPE